MQDVKYLTKKRRKGLLRRLVQRQNQPSINSYKRLIEPQPARSRLRIILPAVALLLAAIPVISLIVNAKSIVSTGPKKPVPPARTSQLLKELDVWQSFQLCADSLPLGRSVGNRLQTDLPGGGTVAYTINEELQERVKSFLKEKQVPYGVFVALEPKTGRVLAMTSHSSIDPSWEKSAYNGLYPMASLFKIITASAALEQKKVSPDTVFAFNGKLTSVNPKAWYVRPRRNQEMSLTEAMGKSVNPVFGRLASDVVGRESLLSSAERFGFNQLLFPGTAISPSKAEAPQSDSELKLMGAGLGREVKISPVHAAAMMAAVANRGWMMAPVLADEVKNSVGETVFSSRPQPLRRMVNEETAGQLARMLSTTVRSGTSRKAFHDRRGRPILADVTIAAKTGSIDGKEPEGHYSWFAAYAPMNDPQIALVALVVNQGRWKIKATHVGEKALEAFFR